MHHFEHLTPGRIAALVICSWAFLRGGIVEKSGAAVIAIGWIATIIVNSLKGPPNLAFVTVDIVTLCAFLALVVWSNKAWTIFLAGFQLIAVASHFTSAFLHLNAAYKDWWSYSAVINICTGWGLLLVLGIGVWAHQRDIKRGLNTTEPAVQH